MKDSNTLKQRKAAARGLNLLAACGIVAVLAVAGTAMVLVGPDDANAKETVIRPAE